MLRLWCSRDLTCGGFKISFLIDYAVLYVRTRDMSFIRAEDLKRELAIPDHLFAEALGAFRVGDQLTVEVIDSGGESYLRLGQRGRDNCE